MHRPFRLWMTFIIALLVMLAQPLRAATVVLYDDSRTPLAARAYYLLSLHGFDMSRVKILQATDAARFNAFSLSGLSVSALLISSSGLPCRFCPCAMASTSA